ncbi:MAG: galactokinase [Clostridiales Family XIII bacterium]|jgi:galactokinase|nr:galactokinase [Clostridiales Family XIII bacterium]
MSDLQKLKNKIRDGVYDGAFALLYPVNHAGGEPGRRYLSLLETFETGFGIGNDVRLFSAPGRIEIGGNHTDHQRGVVLAAAIDTDVLCAATPSPDNTIFIRSAGYSDISVSLEDLSVHDDEKGSPSAIVRGVAAWFRKQGYDAGGFRAAITSNVSTGSGLSSSAAFEVATGGIMNALYNEHKVGSVDIAIAGKYAENEYFGKPSGLMDQMASSVGGLVSIDFNDPAAPVVRRIDSHLADAGYDICIVDTKGSHADLTHEYATIPEEMGRIAAAFGKDALTDVDEQSFFARVPKLRETCGDRSVLRAMHFFTDNQLALREADALAAGDIREFLSLVRRSGRSSLACLQNIFSASDPARQGISVALALSERFLSETGGAWRVHGGGFAGTILAFVPDKSFDDYKREMDGVFGTGSCRRLAIRPVGGAEVLPEMAPDGQCPRAERSYSPDKEER